MTPPLLFLSFRRTLNKLEITVLFSVAKFGVVDNTSDHVDEESDCDFSHDDSGVIIELGVGNIAHLNLICL